MDERNGKMDLERERERGRFGSRIRLTIPPHPRQLHHVRLPRIHQPMEPRREELGLGEDAHLVHVAVGIGFHVGEAFAQCEGVGGSRFAVEVPSAEEGEGLDGQGESEEGEEEEHSSHRYRRSCRYGLVFGTESVEGIVCG